MRKFLSAKSFVETLRAQCRRSPWIAICAAAIAFASTRIASAQEEALPGLAPSGMDYSAPPVTDMGAVSFFSQDLGTMLRLRYNTESYGQNNHGNFDIGSMQVLTFEDRMVFVDGQVTMNDVQGVGFNVGTGFRWLSPAPTSLDGVRMQGVSIWADGTSTREDNFFPQLGLSYENLGELWDFRSNGYIPLGPQDKIGDFEPTGEQGFFQNFVGDLTQAVVNSSLYVAEIEVARRLGQERDAWAFAGPYVLANDDLDTAGYRVGVRGYAYPDLLLQFAVSDDELFATNATFSVTWFVGRTRTDFQPACGVPDRFREPVLRNDYVALAQSFVGSGIPFTDANGNPERFVHIDGSKTTPGDGTYEDPLSEDQVDQVQNFSLPGDNLYAWSGSVFNGQGSAILQPDQNLIGEGDGVVHTLDTAQGTIIIPESRPGARSGDRPVFNGSTDDVFFLSDGNNINNFTIDGQGITERAIVGVDVGGTSSLANLDIRNTTNTGLSILDNSDVNLTVADTVTFTDIAGTAIQIDGDAGGTADQINGTITINSTITNSTTLNDTDMIVVQDLGAGARVIFNGSITQELIGGEGISVTSNSTGARTDFNGAITLLTGANDAFVAENAGTLEVSNTGNTIRTTTGQIARITDTTIAAEDVRFNTYVRSAADNDAAIQLENNTGGSIEFGDALETPAQSGNSIAGGSADAIIVRNSNASIASVNINNTDNTVSGILVDVTTGTQTVDLSQLEINGGLMGIEVTGTGTPTLNMTINDSLINDPAAGVGAAGISFTNIDLGTIQVNNTTIDGNAANANTVGVRIDGSNANFTFDVDPANDNTIIRNFNGTDFLVSGGSGSITFNGQIDNRTDGAGHSVQITGRSGGSVTFGTQSEIDDDNFGIDITNNTAGNVSFLGDAAGDFDLDTGADNALFIDNNSGGTYTFNNFTIDTTSGDGVDLNSPNNSTATYNFSNLDSEASTSGKAFSAIGDGTLAVTGTSNVLRTNTGVALEIQDMTVSNSGVQFQSINVTNGATNAIYLEDLSGAGAVILGSPTGAADSGGTLNTAAEAIVIRNVTNVDVNNIRIASAGDDALLIEHTAASTNAMDVTIDGLNLDSTTGTGLRVSGANNTNNFNLRLLDGDYENNVEVEITGAGDFAMLVDSTNVNTTGADIAFAIEFSGGPTGSGDITFRNQNAFEAENQSALSIDVFGNNSKTVRLLVQDSSFSNNSAANASSNIRSRDNSLLQATIQGNTFENTEGTGSDFDMTAMGTAQSRIQLNLGGDDPDDFNTAAGAVGEFNLIEDPGGTADFRVFEAEDTFDGNRNSGDVIPDPAEADFPNLPTPPPLPTVP